MAKAANAQSPTTSQPPDLSELTISHSPTHAAPPRPPPMSKPAHSSPPPPPRLSQPAAAPVATYMDDDDDDDDPFGDKHELDTPGVERDQPRW